jgi:hypothetical protein
MGHSTHLRRSAAAQVETLMHPSSRLGRTVLVAFVGTALAACTSAPTLMVGSDAPSAPAATLAPSAIPTVVASAIETSSPAETVEPVPDPTASAIDVPISSPMPTPRPLASPKMAAGCPTGENWLSASPDRVPQTLGFGHATIEFTPAGVGLLDGAHFVDDAIPGGVGLSPKESAVVVAPGDHVILRAAGLTLSHVNPGVGPWSDVSFEGGLANLPTDLAPLQWRYRPDGSISISSPTEPGDYAVAFNPRWFGSCLQGDGTAYGRLKVVTP